MTDRLKLALLFIALMGAPLAAQEAGANQTRKQYPSSSDLTLEFVRVDQAQRMMPTLEQLYGRQLIVLDDGSQRSIYNLMLLGDNILLHDTPDKVKAMKEGIELILLRTSDDPLTSSENVRSEIVVEHIGLDEAIHALADLAHVDGIGPQGQTYSNLRLVASRNMIIVNDSKANTDEMRRIMARIDTPRPQVLIRCRIVQGSEDVEQPDPRIAKLLPPEMKELTRFENFEMLATGAIRVSTGGDQPIQMQMSGRDGLAAELELRAGGYSPETKTLRLDRVQFGFNGPMPIEKGARRETQQLMTSTTLPADEIVVIGALGENPIFVILEMDVIGG